MSHLSPATFIDLIEGAVGEGAVPHLAECATCRQQLADMRETWRAARDVEVPEPSPLFWAHLSERVRSAVEAEPSPATTWRFARNWHLAGAIGIIAAVLAIAVGLRLAPQQSGAIETSLVPSQTSVALPNGLPPMEPLTEDPSLTFVADLASNIDWDRAEEFGLPAHGDAERVVVEMNDEERAELRRLLNEALGTGANSM
jgi:hypothetical protein